MLGTRNSYCTVSVIWVVCESDAAFAVKAVPVTVMVYVPAGVPGWGVRGGAALPPPPPPQATLITSSASAIISPCHPFQRLLPRTDSATNPSAGTLSQKAKRGALRLGKGGASIAVTAVVLMVRVVLPPAAIELLAKLHAESAGNPEHASVTLPLNPPSAFVVMLIADVALPAFTVALVGLALIWKSCTLTVATAL